MTNPPNDKTGAGLQPDAGRETYLAARLARHAIGSVAATTDTPDQMELDFTDQAPAAPQMSTRRTSGVEQAEENSDSWWLDCAWRAVEEMAVRGIEFEAADLVDLGVPEPDHPNRWGALMRAAHTKHLIKPVGYKQSRRAARAGGVTRTWMGVRS